MLSHYIFPQKSVHFFRHRHHSHLSAFQLVVAETPVVYANIMALCLLPFEVLHYGIRDFLPFLLL